MAKPQQNEGFSLTELMIVVAIIAILAAIAIPRFWNFAYKSKMSEATSNIATIRTAQFGYFAANDIFMECGPSPPNPAGTDGIPRPWAETLNSFGQKGF
ncbi:prepilin-type N-terminal cleavage/methylation domain-containing protein, partial [Candidatus Poribacteria bacterium]